MTQQDSESIAPAGEVFISYSWDSEAHLRGVLELSNRLRSEGIDCVIDQYEVSPPDGWPRWMDKKIRVATHLNDLHRDILQARHGRGKSGQRDGSTVGRRADLPTFIQRRCKPEVYPRAVSS